LKRYRQQRTVKSTATDECINSAVGRSEEHTSVLAPEIPDMDAAQFKACVTCTATLDRDQIPRLSSSNGFTYPPLSNAFASERLVTPRLPFMQIRRLRHQIGGYDIVGQ
jgi:hypothetical protein